MPLVTAKERSAERLNACTDEIVRNPLLLYQSGPRAHQSSHGRADQQGEVQMSGEEAAAGLLNQCASATAACDDFGNGLILHLASPPSVGIPAWLCGEIKSSSLSSLELDSDASCDLEVAFLTYGRRLGVGHVDAMLPAQPVQASRGQVFPRSTSSRHLQPFASPLLSLASPSASSGPFSIPPSPINAGGAPACIETRPEAVSWGLTSQRNAAGGVPVETGLGGSLGSDGRGAKRQRTS